MAVLHQKLAQGEWQKLSFYQQLGNIGAEISRARGWWEKGDELGRERALERALELITLTLSQNLGAPRFKELSRFKEVIIGLNSNADNYQVSFKDLENFCLNFALLARS